MNTVADKMAPAFINDEESLKLIACCNFPDEIMNGMRLFFMARGYATLKMQTTAETLQSCRETPYFLIFINVDSYDTSWIQLITSMKSDVLVYRSPLVVICRQQDEPFFRKQQRIFSYELLTYPPSMRSTAAIIDKYELLREGKKRMEANNEREMKKEEKVIIRNTISEQKQNLRVLCVDDSPSALASLKYAMI